MIEKLKAKETEKSHPKKEDESEKKTWVQIYARNLWQDEKKGNNNAK